MQLNIEVKFMGRNVNNIKSINLLFPNCLSQVWGGSEPPLTHNNVVCAYLFNKLSQEKIFPYCVSSGVSGLCPDGIRLEIFKRGNENLLCRSEQKFSFRSFKISFNSAGVLSFAILFFLCLRNTKKEKYLKKINPKIDALFVTHSLEQRTGNTQETPDQLLRSNRK